MSADKMKSKITKDEIIALAKLTKLSLNDKEIEQYTEEISDLLKYFEQLDKLDLEGVEPTISVGVTQTVSRPDTVSKQVVSPKDLRAILPSKQDNYIKVKRMI